MFEALFVFLYFLLSKKTAVCTIQLLSNFTNFAFIIKLWIKTMALDYSRDVCILVGFCPENVIQSFHQYSLANALHTAHMKVVHDEVWGFVVSKGFHSHESTKNDNV